MSADSITIYRGASFAHLVTFTRTSDGTPLDLTGAEITSEVRTSAGGDLVCTFTVEDVDLANGQIRLVLADEITKVITKETGSFDILIKWSDGTAMRSPAARVDIKPGITINP